MPRHSVRPLVAAAVIFALLIPILIVGGLSVRGQIASAFARAEHVRTTRAIAIEALRLQLDEESGVRAYAATRDPAFLRLYRVAKPRIAVDLRKLEATSSARLPAAMFDVRDAAAANATWLATVAEPSIAMPSSAESSRASASDVEMRGNALLDRFRSDIAAADALFEQREREIDGQAEAAINRIVLLVGVAAVLVALLAYIFTALQLRTMGRLDEQRRRADELRRRADEERRAADELRIAYEAEKRIADVLQDAVVQRSLPAVPSMRFSGVYVPATHEARVGGDWYDALELPSGRVMFTIGDVTGHGLDAAVNMSRARQAVIAAALADASPASVLARANLELLRRDSPLVTAVVGYADAERYEFVYSIAGHPPPMLLEPGREPRMLTCGALPLGAVAEAEYDLYRVPTVAGATLVLYTDGAIEHTRDLIEGERRLLEAASRALRDAAADPARVIHDQIFADSEAGDDVAILTVGFAVAAESGFTISASDADADFAGRLGRGGPT